MKKLLFTVLLFIILDNATAQDKTIIIKNADEMTLIVSMATNYNSTDIDGSS